jgi:hypothetical protein
METHAFLLSPQVVFAARAGYGGDFVYPNDSIPYSTTSGTYSGSEAAIRPGMTVTVGSTALGDDQGRGRMQTTVTSSGTLKTNTFSQGTHDGEFDMTTTSYITVWDDYRVWAKLPRTVQGLGTLDFYKDGNIPPGDLLANVRPVANVTGSARMGTIDPITGKFYCQLDGTESWQFDHAHSYGLQSASTYTWSIADGVQVGGTDLHDPVINVNFPPGFRWVHLTVTAWSGKTHTANIPIFARDPDADVCVAHQIANYRVTPKGQEVSLRILQDVPRSTYPDGTLLMLWVGDEIGSPINFVGWHQSDDNTMTTQRTATLKDITMNFVDITGRLSRLPGMSQVVQSLSFVVTATALITSAGSVFNVKPLERPIPNGTVLSFTDGTSPGTVTLSSAALAGDEILNISAITGTIYGGAVATYTKPVAELWTETISPNFMYYAWYLLQWHSTAIDLGGLLPSETLPAVLPNRLFHEVGSDESDLFSQVEKIVGTVDPDHHLTCTRDGKLMLTLDPNLLETADRYLSTFAFDNLEITELTFSDERSPKVYKLTAYGIVGAEDRDSGLKCVAPGEIEGQGVHSVELTDRYVDDDYTFAYVEGHRYARYNNRHGPVQVKGTYELNASFPDPALMQFIVFTIPEMPRHYVGLPGWVQSFTRFIITEASFDIQYSQTGTTCLINFSLEEETFGPPARIVTTKGKFL